jgi:hypothetical protein
MRITIDCDTPITIDLNEDEVVDVYITEDYVRIEAGCLEEDDDDGGDDAPEERPFDWTGRSGGLN